MVQEAVAEPTQAVVPEGLTADPVETPTPSPEGAGLIGEAATTEEAPAPSVYSTIHDPYDLIEHETVKPIIDQRVSRVVSDRKAELEAEYGLRTKDWESQQTSRTLHGIAGPLLEAIRNENVTGFERGIAALEKISEANDPATQERMEARGEESGFTKGQTAMFAAVRSAAMETLDERGKDAIQPVLREASTWNEVMGFLKDRWTAPHKAELEKAKQEIERLKLNGRTVSPNLAEGGGSGGKAISSMADADRRYVLPQEHPDKISHDEYRAYRSGK